MTPMETQLIELIGSNIIGVTFGLLMYRMADNSIKENTQAIHELVIFLRSKK